MNPESASDYVAQSNLKAMIEWLTAEAILTRPEDPIQFARDLLGQKLVERRKQTQFQPDEATQWLRATYAKAVAEVDENGIIHGENIPNATFSVSEELALLKIKMDGAQTIIRTSVALSVLDKHEIAQNALPHITRILSCDRSVIHIYDPVTNEMIIHASAVSEGRTSRIPRDVFDISGSAISSREMVNITDAYSDSRFDTNARELDKDKGYRTVSILCAPMISPSGEVIGAVQGINKETGNFEQNDEDLLRMMADQMAVSMYNANTYQTCEKRRTNATLVAQIMGVLACQLDDRVTALETILSRTPAIAGADRVMLYLVDEKKQILYELSPVGADMKPHSMDRGLPAKAMSTNAMINLKDAYDSPLFNAAQDKQTGYLTKALLTAPIRSGENNKVIGVIQFMNKLPSTSEPPGGAAFFTAMDEEMVTTLLDSMGHLIGKSQIFHHINNKPKKAEKTGSDSESDRE